MANVSSQPWQYVTNGMVLSEISLPPKSGASRHWSIE
jgi:hypothetical protein